MDEFFTSPRREFIAHGLMNLGLVLITAGFVSDVFISLKTLIKFATISVGVIALIGSVIVFPPEGGK